MGPILGPNECQAGKTFTNNGLDTIVAETEGIRTLDTAFDRITV